MKPRGGPPLWLMNSRGGPPFLGCMLMNSRGGPPILRGGPPLGTISMDQTVLVHSRINFQVNAFKSNVHIIRKKYTAKSADFAHFSKFLLEELNSQGISLRNWPDQNLHFQPYKRYVA